MMVERLGAKGVRLGLDGDGLQVETDAPLTDEQRTFLREHKAELVAELKAEQALEAVIRKLVAEATQWYTDDAEDIAAMNLDGVEVAVRDYLARREYYQRGIAEERQPGEQLKNT
jgi:hypothetical protein